MDRRKFIQIMGVGAAAAIPAGAGMALGQVADTTGESTVYNRPDGSLVIVGQIEYNQSLQGYVVQALIPAGSFGQYLIVNPDDRVLNALAKSGTIVTVKGMLTGGSLLFLVQTIDGRHYH